jgi:Fe-Mn family superoxide dismutase
MQKTLEVHHGKHHQAYVTNLNAQIAGKDLESLSIEEVSERCAVSSSAMCTR